MPCRAAILSRAARAPVIAFAAALCFAPGCAEVEEAPPEGVEMSVFRVPSRHGLAPTSRLGLTPTTRLGPEAVDEALDPETEEAATVLLPPDVLAAPDEAPRDALARALRDHTEPRGGGRDAERVHDTRDADAIDHHTRDADTFDAAPIEPAPAEPERAP